MAIEIVSVPTKKADFPQLCKHLTEGAVYPVHRYTVCGAPVDCAESCIRSVSRKLDTSCIASIQWNSSTHSQIYLVLQLLQSLNRGFPYETWNFLMAILKIWIMEECV